VGARGSEVVKVSVSTSEVVDLSGVHETMMEVDIAVPLLMRLWIGSPLETLNHEPP